MTDPDLTGIDIDTSVVPGLDELVARLNAVEAGVCPVGTTL